MKVFYLYCRNIQVEWIAVYGHIFGGHNCILCSAVHSAVYILCCAVQCAVVHTGHCATVHPTDLCKHCTAVIPDATKYRFISSLPLLISLIAYSSLELHPGMIENFVTWPYNLLPATQVGHSKYHVHVNIDSKSVLKGRVSQNMWTLSLVPLWENCSDLKMVQNCQISLFLGIESGFWPCGGWNVALKSDARINILCPEFIYVLCTRELLMHE